MNHGADPTPIKALYDPLCGWCYGATPAFRRLVGDARVHLTLAPTGLFSGPGARPMDEAFAAYAWANDRRIEQLTGQRFSKRYRDDVLGARGATLDSGPATMALTAVALTDPDRELDALEVIQAARYVEGRDVTHRGVLVDVLRDVGLDQAATRLAGADAGLVAAVAARIATARGLLRTVGARGVPTVVAGADGSQRLISSDRLRGPLDDLLRDLRAA